MNMGTNYIELSLDAMSDAAAAAEASKREPDLSYLPHLRTAISIMHLMIACINTVLVPLAASSMTVRREMEKSTTLAISRIEEQINTIEQRSVDAVLNWVSRLLSNQNRNDYRPRDDASDDSLMQLQTPVSLSSSSHAVPILTFSRHAILYSSSSHPFTAMRH
jgi:exocyst complex component 5